MSDNPRRSSLSRHAQYVGSALVGVVVFSALLFRPPDATGATSPVDSLSGVIDSLKKELSVRPLDPVVERDSLVAWEARRVGVPVMLAIAVARVENPLADSTAVSRRGAVGLMQIMAGVHLALIQRECRYRHILERRCNVRVGLLILKNYGDSLGSWEQALRAYNGALDYQSAGDRYVAAVEHRGGRIMEGW